MKLMKEVPTKNSAKGFVQNVSAYSSQMAWQKTVNHWLGCQRKDNFQQVVKTIKLFDVDLLI